MLRKLTRQFIFSRLVFCLVPLAIMPTQHDAKSGKRPELITVQMKVMDIKTGSTIDNADVLIKWSEGPEPHSATATTNSSGVARLTDVPRGKVEIRVIAKGYKVLVPPPLDLVKEEQPIKIEMTKQTLAEEHAKDIPPK